MTSMSGITGTPKNQQSFHSPETNSSGDGVLTPTAEAVDTMVMSEERAIVIGASGERLTASTATGLGTIHMDTRIKQERAAEQARLSKALVLKETPPVSTSTHSKDHAHESPYSEGVKRRFRGYKEHIPAKPPVNFAAQAKAMVPTRIASTGVLLGTQKISQKHLGDSSSALAASWFLAVAAENGINIPLNAVRHQMQTGQAKTAYEALTQVIGKKGVMGLYKCYPLNTVSGFLINMALNEISPRLTSAFEEQFPNMPTGSKMLLPLVMGSAASVAMIPLTQSIYNINYHQLDVNDKRTTLQIARDLIKAGPRTLLRGAAFGAKRIAVVGAIYNGTIHMVQSGQKKVKKKDVEKVTGMLAIPTEDLLTGGGGTAESWQVVKEDSRKIKEAGKKVAKTLSEIPVEDMLTGGGGSAESWKGVTGLVSSAFGAISSAASWLVRDINRSGRDPVMDEPTEYPTSSSSSNDTERLENMLDMLAEIREAESQAPIDGRATGKITEEDETPVSTSTPSPVSEEDYPTYFTRILADLD